MTPSALHDPLLLLLAGIVFDAVFGDLLAVFACLPHPVALAGRAIAFFEHKLNRTNRSEANRRGRGVAVVIMLVGTAAVIGWGLQQVCRGSVVGAAIEVLAIG